MTAKVTLPPKIARGELEGCTLLEFPFSGAKESDWYSDTYERDAGIYATLPLRLRLTAVCHYRFVDFLAKVGVLKSWGVS
jgi:hypothetical protein